MKRLLAALAAVSLLAAGGCTQMSRTASEQPAVSKPAWVSASRATSTQPTSAPVYTAWPFDAEEAARRQDETAKALSIGKEVDELVVGKLIAQLDDETFAVREEATKRLIEFGESIQLLLKRKLRERELGLETVARIQTVLDKTIPILDLGNNVTLKLAIIPAGKFIMGSPEGEKERQSYEGPQHEVTISKPFYMAIHKVTQEQYEQVMGENPSKFEGAANPVEQVSWYDAVEFCKKLSTKTGKMVQLPTEAQWEYSCRAGTKTTFTCGDNANQLGDYAWIGNNSGYKTHPVAQKNPNAWGLYDVNGNVQEWCSDWYDWKYYENTKDVDPTGPASSTTRVLRGCSFGDDPWMCRSACRHMEGPTIRNNVIGFRVVVELDENRAATQPTSQRERQ